MDVRSWHAITERDSVVTPPVVLYTWQDLGPWLCPDIVVAADVVYHRELFEPLLHTLSEWQGGRRGSVPACVCVSASVCVCVYACVWRGGGHLSMCLHVYLSVCVRYNLVWCGAVLRCRGQRGRGGRCVVCSGCLWCHYGVTRCEPPHPPAPAPHAAALCRPGTLLLLAHVRRWKSDKHFFNRLQKAFDVEEVADADMDAATAGAAGSGAGEVGDWRGVQGSMEDGAGSSGGRAGGSGLGEEVGGGAATASAAVAQQAGRHGRSKGVRRVYRCVRRGEGRGGRGGGGRGGYPAADGDS